jgi:2-C-methyl-D-erythritol 4-phosphate cytidylyltransferase/2-C-methyl-D-erythritol 2,4-cyclodiphosphate synthase
LTGVAGAAPASVADVIVVAAGSSSRMGTDKLLAPLGDRPLLAHTLAALVAAPGVGALVVVTTPDRRRRLDEGGWVPRDRLVAFADGGDRRQDSVRHGVAALETLVPDPDGRRVVLIHDGARPLVSTTLVAAVAEAAAEHGAAIPVLPLGDTIKRISDGRIESTLDRTTLGAAQTPQGVRRGLLRAALASPVARKGSWTDEAALLEACRIPVRAIPGDPENIKVTVPADLARAAASIAPADIGRRTGIGHDSHPFGPGMPLRLGGIDIEGAPRLYGHSDGDVVLHAVADALLGAGGLGDLGRIFPAGPATPKGVDSRELLVAVMARLSEAGWRPVAADLTIVGARPRLADHLESIRASVASVLGVDRSAVNVKASSGNLDGSEGAGRAMSTLALATIEAAR